MCYVQEQNNNDSGLFFFLGDWRGAAGGGGTGSRPETSCVEGSVSRPAVATGGTRRRGSGRPSSGVDDVLLVLVDAIVSHARRVVWRFRTDARRRTSAELTLLRHLRLGRTRPVVVAPSDCAARMRLCRVVFARVPLPQLCVPCALQLPCTELVLMYASPVIEQKGTEARRVPARALIDRYSQYNEAMLHVRPEFSHCCH